MYDVSIIIPHLSGASMLLDCLNSIYGKGRPIASFEVIVVFNGSNDDSVEACAQNYPQVKRIELPTNLGFSVAVNIGIRESHGQYLLLLNNDTIVLPGAIDRLLDYIKSDQRTGIVAPKLLYPDMSLQRACHEFPTLTGLLTNALFLHILFPWSRRFGWTNMTYWNYSDTRPVDWVSAACILVRRDALMDVGLLDEKSPVAGDLDLCWRMCQKGWKTVFIHDAQIIHLLGQSSWRKCGIGAVNTQMMSHILNLKALYYWFYDQFGRDVAAKYFLIVKLDAVLRVPIFFVLSLMPHPMRISNLARFKAYLKILALSLSALENEYKEKIGRS
jgi:GT2 family glycosyltransferase